MLAGEIVDIITGAIPWRDCLLHGAQISAIVVAYIAWRNYNDRPPSTPPASSDGAPMN